MSRPPGRIVAAVAVVVAVAVAATVALRDDGKPGETDLERPGDASDLAFTWPDPGGSRLFDEVEEAAGTFALEYLRVGQPQLEGADPPHRHWVRYTVRSGRVDSSVRTAGAPRTVVDLRLLPSGPSHLPHWFVVAATSPNLVVEHPTPETTVSGSFRLSGRARHLSGGRLLVEVRTQEGGAPVITVPVRATRSSPGVAEFAVDVPFGGLPVGRGGIVVRADSGPQLSPEATVVPVTFRPLGDSKTVEVRPYLIDARGDFVPAPRQVPGHADPLRATLLALLGGATPEERARGLRSPFAGEGKLLRGVTVTTDGFAVVDFEPAVVDALAGADAAAVLASLDHTVFQFPTVFWVTYRVGGECRDFAGLGTDLLCERRSRDEY